MKKKLLFLSGFMCSIVLVIFVSISLFFRGEALGTSKPDTDLKVVASFYPTYIIGLNVLDQIPGIEISSITNTTVGCLDNYQLTTDNMKLLADADVLLINGGGMESFIEDVIKNYPKLTIINISEGIPMLDSAEKAGEPNPHVWLDPSRYITQIENVRDGLTGYVEKQSQVSSDYKNEVINKINSNADAYLQKVNKLETDYEELFKKVNESASLSGNNKVVIFHEAFAYLAARAGLDVAYTVEIEGDSALRTKEIADVVDLIKKDDIKYLFTEKQYGPSITDRIKEETDAKVYIIDSAVTGDGTKDSYLNAMQNNLNALKEAFNIK